MIKRKKRQGLKLSFDERAILCKIVNNAELKSASNVLEVSFGVGAAESGAFDGIGCCVEVIAERSFETGDRIRLLGKDFEKVDGGNYDFILLFNVGNSDLIKRYVEKARGLLSESGEIAVLNTKNVMNSLALSDCGYVSTEKFSLFIIKQTASADGL